MSKHTAEEILARLRNGNGPFATVSGILTTRPGIIEEIDRRIPEIGVITTKSFQVSPNPGNREPVIVEMSPGCYGNAVGLRNPGMEKGFQELMALRKRKTLRALLNISLSGSSPPEFGVLVRKFEEAADMFELNFSCPHAEKGYGMSIGTDPDLVYSYVRALRGETGIPLFAKLTPNADNIGEIAEAAIAGGADGISAINTVGPELYIEPHSGKPILMNPRGNRGGMSGSWVKKTALDAVRKIRSALGPEIPIIGMGGIETGEDARNMKEAGADIIGLGSVFSRINPADWNDYFASLSGDLSGGTNSSARFVSPDRRMEYKPFKISRKKILPGGLGLMELEGNLAYRSSQFAFLWIPGVGEKPFSVACGSPLTFVIKEKGIVSRALLTLDKGDTLYVRGVYGAPARTPDLEKIDRIVIAAGGTGIAVAPKLAEECAAAGKNVLVYYGFSRRDQEVLENPIKKFARFMPIADDGMQGRAAYAMLDEIGRNGTIGRTALYTIGPVQFMERAAYGFRDAGGDPEMIFLSLETVSLCGVGLCGTCECGGRLTCREGSFFSLKFLDDRGISPGDFQYDY